jgi:hypothetical protein
VARTAVEIALLAWVAAALPTFRVVYANQASPRPARPYATVAVPTDRSTSATPCIQTTTTPTGDGRHFDQTRTWARQGTVRVELYADAAADWAKTLEYSPRLEAIDAQLRAAGITVGKVLSNVDESTMRDTAWEGRAVLDFRFTYRDQVTVPVDTIETFTSSVTYEDPT